MSNELKKISVARLSIFSNLFLVITKVIVGLLIGSVSVISEAIHSGLDLIASFIAYIAVSHSSKPADREHPYGHGKYENVSGLAEAMLILVAAVWIIYEAIHKLLNPAPLEHSELGIAVMAISCIVNYFISRKLFKVAKETDSMALEADGWHLRSDVYTSLGVLSGLAIILTGHIYVPSISLSWIDPVFALAVAMILLKTTYDLTKKTLGDLFDTSINNEELEWINNRLRSNPEVRGFHHLRTRKAGHQYFVEFHMVVDGHLTVALSHQFTDLIANDIKEKLGHAVVTVHVEPCDNSCRTSCLSGCFSRCIKE